MAFGCSNFSNGFPSQNQTLPVAYKFLPVPHLPPLSGSSVSLRLSHQPPFWILHSAIMLPVQILAFSSLRFLHAFSSRKALPCTSFSSLLKCPLHREAIPKIPSLPQTITPSSYPDLFCFYTQSRIPHYLFIFHMSGVSLSLEHKLQYGQGLHYVHTKNSVA